MLGAISGDIIGSVFEVRSIKTTDFPLFSESSTFTDDTVLTIAIADSIRNNIPYAINLKKYYKRYPFAGYGGSFRNWAASESMEPYYSWGNGSAMRVSPVGFAFEDLHEVLAEAERSAAVTHNHPEGIKGAQAVAAAIFLARKGSDKNEIKRFIEDRFSYDLNEPLDEIREYYRFDVSCQGSVPQSIISFLEADDVEDAIRKAISLGGDSDTMACIAGGIAHAYYKKIPDQIAQTVLNLLDEELRITAYDFMNTYAVTY
jgi:ADP-ribosylglycohydrolase